MAYDQPVCFVNVLDPLLPDAEDDDEIVRVGEIWADPVSVEVTGPSTLLVTFDNGIAGNVRFEPAYLTGVFAKLKDPAYFAKVGIANGAVSWPNEMPDLAPDVMYDAIVARGEWVLA